MPVKKAAKKVLPASPPKPRAEDVEHVAGPLRALAWPLKYVRPDPKNARTHSDRNLDDIAGSIAEWGQDQVIVANRRTRRIVKGHGRYLAMTKKLGVTWGAVVWVDDDVPAARARAIADNRAGETSEWDWSLLAEGLEGSKAEDARVQRMLEDLNKEAQKFIARIAATEPQEPSLSGGGLNDKPITRMGDLWAMGSHRLGCGDAYKRVSWDALMGGKRAALVVTSPPYNQKLDSFKASGMQKENPAWVQRMASSYEDSMPEDKYQGLQVRMLKHAYRYSEANASVFYNHKVRYRDKQVVHPMTWIARSPFRVRQEIVWRRGGSVTLNARMFMPSDERIYWLTRSGSFVFHGAAEIKAWSTVWDIAAHNDALVSAPFASEVPRRCIVACSRKGDVVVDPFMGSGTVIVEAERNDRVGFGIEADPRYCDYVVERWEALTGGKAKRVKA